MRKAAESVSSPAGRRRLWPDFDPAWILHEDASLLVVDKPAGISCQAADPARPDDLVHRLKLHLVERDGGRPYVGTHQRLDQETSGVLVYTRDKAANPAIARQMEGREVEKEYLVAVRGYRGGKRTLRHHLAPGRDGVQEVHERAGRRSKEAVSRVDLVERVGDRALLSVRIETGRTHQVRAQLAHIGAPVAGDRLYGGPLASRLMLHAHRIRLRHPETGEGRAFEAPLPVELKRWLAGEEGVSVADTEGFTAALGRASHRRWWLSRSEGASETSAFRLLNDAGDGVPGLALDVYGDYLVAHVYSEEVEAALEPLLDRLDALGFSGIYLKRRRRQANELVDTRREEVAPSGPLRGEVAPDPLIIREEGIPYRVRLGDGLSTGIFLDQRANRLRVRELARGKRVLNLFAYTCAFSSAAAAGGASSTLSVDIARPGLDWGRENVALVSGDEGAHRFARADVFDALAGFAQTGERFDLIIADPPTYATTKSSRWKSGSDWERLAAAAFGVAADGATLFLSSNDRRMSHNRFRRYLHEAARRADREIIRMRDASPVRDFPDAASGASRLKAVWVELGRA